LQLFSRCFFQFKRWLRTIHFLVSSTEQRFPELELKADQVHRMTNGTTVMPSRITPALRDPVVRAASIFEALQRELTTSGSYTA